MELNQYMSIFLEESREHLQTLNNCVLELENNPDNHRLLDEIFRSAHTLKGMAATMGFNAIAELTHEMENVLDLLRKGQLDVTPPIVDTLFQCIDTLEQTIEAVTSGNEHHGDVSLLVRALHQCAGKEAAPEVAVALQPARAAVETPTRNELLSEFEKTVISSAETKGLNTFEVHVTLDKDCLLKAARAYMVFAALENLGEVIKAIPEVEEIERENFDLSFTVIIVTAADAKQVETSLLSISEIAKVIVVPVVNGARAKVLAQSKVAIKMATPSDYNKLNEQVTNNGAKKARTASQTVRVDIEKLDTLLNLVGELVINKTRLEQIGSHQKLTELSETIEHMGRITTDLQSVVMKVRMVPIGQVFNRFPRMVRDLARELGKEIEFIVQGEDTELDRTVSDEIGEPLVHLLRNALDHGIELPAERAARGKQPMGTVKLSARHEGNNVIIEVEDDGKGIDPAVIRAKVVEKGLLARADVDKLDDNEVIRLIFLPGFSTATQVTDVSGRGVGMDAVKAKIESLGGMVEVETKAGVGSKFSIRLPLTLAIIQALLISVGNEKYAIPLGSIDSTIKITMQDIRTVHSREVILLRGHVIPIVKLKDALRVPGGGADAGEDAYVVIVHMGERRAGFIVDTLIGQQEIVIKSLGKFLGTIKTIAGATILGDGQVALILDVGALIN